MEFLIDPAFHMWFVLGLTGVAVIAFIREAIPLEVSSVLLLTCLLLFGQFMPLPDADGRNQLDALSLLAGFANPSLIAVLCLLVMGQAIIQTNALRLLVGIFSASTKKTAWLSIIGIFTFVMSVSAFLNNTPLVIIAIPILQSLAHSVGLSQSRVMIPLSYVAILGGMTTLIGSSTNLLVASTMVELGYDSLQFFDFVIPGMMMAAVGFIYVLLFVPKILPDRSSMVGALRGNKKEFVAELDINEDSKLIGMECEKGRFPGLDDLNVKLIQRGGHLILPPFEGYVIEAGDILIASATRESLTGLLAQYPGFLLSEEEEEMMETQNTEEEGALSNEPEARVLAEIMITPASRILDMSIEHSGLDKKFGTIVLGIQRRARVVRRRLGRIRLEAGDVLLVAGRRSIIDGLRDNPDFIMLSGSRREFPAPGKARIAMGVFLLTIVSAALGMLSIPVAAITGAVAMVATGCLNIRQATRAIDRKIFLLVGAMLALGSALQATGGGELYCRFDD